MTSIAFDGKSLACDSQVTSGSLKGRMDKFRRLPGGGVIIVAGEVELIDQAVQDFLDGEPPETLRDADGMERAQFVRLDRSGCWYTSDGTWNKFYPGDAIGSGAAYAITAMHLGLDAKKAVMVACDLDLYSSRPVKTFKMRGVKT
ncbi:50L [Xanthomonas phage Xp10]|uniref:50L n=1 Tax=Xanthomonas phage Xp10 TaxID=2907956 RepID=Q7Y5G6_9CAUD|nr:peptidase HslV family [Xanthomonas phage Xp10]AAP58718.1 50L [Xanthomonas phage Xp10]